MKERDVRQFALNYTSRRQVAGNPATWIDIPIPFFGSSVLSGSLVPLDPAEMTERTVSTPSNEGTKSKQEPIPFLGSSVLKLFAPYR
jgi:hypothetical protein